MSSKTHHASWISLDNGVISAELLNSNSEIQNSTNSLKENLSKPPNPNRRKRNLQDITSALFAKKTRQIEDNLPNNLDKNKTPEIAEPSFPDVQIISVRPSAPESVLSHLLSRKPSNPKTTSSKTWIPASGQNPIGAEKPIQSNPNPNPNSNSNPIRTPTEPAKVTTSKHNDATYYPNIQCILCKEWVCSRNRYIHVESHLQYKPYKCSICGYDNRKEIFISLHLNRIHTGQGKVLYCPDLDLEEKAWQIAEECLQHTRNVLLNQQNGSSKPNLPTTDVSKPKIHNVQRAEKSQQIEESRQMAVGRLVPPENEMVALMRREIECKVCRSHFVRTTAVIEEHVRSHLSAPSYACFASNCATRHWSRHFLLRHTREVHRIRKTPIDCLEKDLRLRKEYFQKCTECFGDFYGDSVVKARQKYSYFTEAPSPNSTSSPCNIGEYNDSCIGCQIGLHFHPLNEKRPCINCTSLSEEILDCRFCSICVSAVKGDAFAFLRHSLSHLSPLPFGCVACPYAHWDAKAVERHSILVHLNTNGAVALNFSKDSIRDRWLSTTVSCFGQDIMVKLGLNEAPQPRCQAQKVQCQVCRSLVGPESMERHLNYHGKVGLMRCSDCPNGRIFSRDKFLDHISAEHGGALVEEPYDLGIFEDLDDLKKLCFPK